MTNKIKNEQGPVGINKISVERWIAQNVDGFSAPATFELIEGGHSNLTYLVIDSKGKKLVLRRPPLSHVLKTAHDMNREFKIISALENTDVPVPKALALCQDLEVNGCHFYVMDFVEGYILRDATSTIDALPTEEKRKRCGYGLINVLSKLHDLDPNSIGLSDFGKGENYIERQIKRWFSQLESSVLEEEAAKSYAYMVNERLLEKLPPQQKIAITHGDYRLDNCVVNSDGQIKAVLDWEISTLGDPLADLGLFMVYWVQKGDPNPLIFVAPTSLDGFPTRQELIEEYKKHSQLNLDMLDFYISFGYFKLGCILQGVLHRYRVGANPEAHFNFSAFSEQVENLFKNAQELIEKV